MTSFTGTSVDYSTRMSYSVNTSLDLSVSTSTNYRFISGTDITQYSSGYSMYTLCGDGSISLGTEGSFSTIGQTFFTPGSIVLGSRPVTGEALKTANIATLAKTQALVRLASYAAKLTALVDEVGTKFAKGFPQSVLDLPAAIMARLAAPAATTAAALVAKSIVGSYKMRTKEELGLPFEEMTKEPTIKIDPDAITLKVGKNFIRIDAKKIEMHDEYQAMLEKRRKDGYVEGIGDSEFGTDPYIFQRGNTIFRIDDRGVFISTSGGGTFKLSDQGALIQSLNTVDIRSNKWIRSTGGYGWTMKGELRLDGDLTVEGLISAKAKSL
ncbi:hypothetical protein KXS07_37190 [Inquilinus limosus]|uniref:hypothetical protein n=1 Tax=Inquilinus limosus TaxID=171674 RepID=UPI003F18734E